jgi:hypothetical protein
MTSGEQSSPILEHVTREVGTARLDNAEELALIAQEIGGEVIRGPLSLLSDWVE